MNGGDQHGHIEIGIDERPGGLVAFAGLLTLVLGVFPGILYGLAEKASLL